MSAHSSSAACVPTATTPAVAMSVSHRSCCCCCCCCCWLCFCISTPRPLLLQLRLQLQLPFSTAPSYPNAHNRPSRAVEPSGEYGDPKTVKVVCGPVGAESRTVVEVWHRYVMERDDARSA